MPDGTVRILSIDGGGIRGIIPAMVVDRLLGSTVAQDAFHIITGTSTGGIIASGLAAPKPMTPNDILSLYLKDGGSIFRSRTLGLLKAKYDQHALQEYLVERLGNASLSDVNKTLNKTELLVPSYAIGLPGPKPPAPMFFRSWQARGAMLDVESTGAQYDFLLNGIACATSAAPTFFPPAELFKRLNERFVMIDGGVFANNPTMAAVVEARRLYNPSNYLVVSIGTGAQPNTINVEEALTWGGNGPWIVPVLNILMSGSAETTNTEVAALLPGDYHRFDISLATPTPEGKIASSAMDDTAPANLAALQAKAEELISKYAQKLDELRELLAKPKDTLKLGEPAAVS